MCTGKSKARGWRPTGGRAARGRQEYGFLFFVFFVQFPSAPRLKFSGFLSLSLEDKYTVLGRLSSAPSSLSTPEVAGGGGM